MKNILLITSLYPANDIKLLNNTSVCHYFAKEWVKLGCCVRVIFLYHLFPVYYYPILKLFNKKIANKSGIAVLDKYLPVEFTYELDGLKVTRIPVKKTRPGGDFKSLSVHHASQRIKQILTEESFTPDLILGHFLHPSLEIIADLRQYYSVKTAVSLHGKENQYNQHTALLLDSIDYVGYRNPSIGKSFEELYGKKPHFLCYSGVPQDYIAKTPKQFGSGIHHFIYVGSLIQRKHPVALISAVSEAFRGDEFSIFYVGDGNERRQIIDCATSLGIVNNICLCGRLRRDEVSSKLDNADIFIMISKDETFGLVYLEAMARGCIVIASRNEGMDGIINHGVNGFLCEAGNAEELAKLLKEIRTLTTDELNEISRKALDTANKYTDTNVAIKYLETFDY